jgi:hypothetical protein
MAVNKVTVIVDDRRLRELIKNLPEGEVVRIVADGTDYGIHQEFGTARGVPPHAFMRPAIEFVRPAFMKGVKQIKNLEKANSFVDNIAYAAEAKAKELAPFEFGNLRASIHVVDGDKFTYKYTPGER